MWINNYFLEQVLGAFENLKQEKWVEKLLNKVKQKCFWDELDESNIEEFKSFVSRFESVYKLMKDEFREKFRDDWVRYFEHLRAVVENVLELPNPNTDKVFISIMHDFKEDCKNVSFEFLERLVRNNYNNSIWIALAIESISKEDFKKYLDFEIKDENQREKQAKILRNEEYFWHLKDFETFKEYIRNLVKQKYFEGKIEKMLTEEEIAEIAKNALYVKFADRIHNLSTQWDPNNIQQVIKKVNETKQYFLNIAKAINKDAYDAIQTLILQLEIRLARISLDILKILNNNKQD